jgi:hypothetical protein
MKMQAIKKKGLWVLSAQFLYDCAEKGKSLTGFYFLLGFYFNFYFRLVFPVSVHCSSFCLVDWFISSVGPMEASSYVLQKGDTALSLMRAENTTANNGSHTNTNGSNSTNNNNKSNASEEAEMKEETEGNGLAKPKKKEKEKEALGKWRTARVFISSTFKVCVLFFFRAFCFLCFDD